MPGEPARGRLSLFLICGLPPLHGGDRRRFCVKSLTDANIRLVYTKFPVVSMERNTVGHDHRAAPGVARPGNGDHDTPAQPQPQAMGATQSDPRRGEIPAELIAASRLMTSQRLIGVSRTNGSALSYKPVLEYRSVKTLFLFYSEPIFILFP